MKRKLVSYDAFKSIISESLTAAERELKELEPILSDTVGTNLELISYNPDTVIYESSDGSYLHASYQFKNGWIKLENIEQLVLDEETEKANSKKIVEKLFDSIMEDKKEEANLAFQEYVNLPKTKRIFSESKHDKRKKRKFVFGNRGEGDAKARLPKSVKRRQMKEWYDVSNNVIQYVNYIENGSIINSTKVESDEKGNLSSITIPGSRLRNEAKVLCFDWKTIEADEKVLRSNAKKLSESSKFNKAIAEIKRYNAFSDNKNLQESIETVVSNWPEIIYLTEDELAQIVKESLEFVNASNYDDDTCLFIAEGLLRTAVSSYEDRINKILETANLDVSEHGFEDKYDQFKFVTSNYYKLLDENFAKEMQAYIDLYESLRQVYIIAKEQDNDYVLKETVTFLRELSSIINEETSPNVTVAGKAANWLKYLVETNLETKDWEVSNSTHISINGDHPSLSDKARKSYSPASDGSGNYRDPAPVSDGAWKLGKGKEDADDMRFNAWGNVGGGDVYPSLNNPYVPKKLGTYTMKGEPGVDQSKDPSGQWSSNDTWPSLQNPVVPKSDFPVMNKGKESDLVINK